MKKLTKDYFKNIQTAHTNQYWKDKKSHQKVGKRPKQTFLQEDIQIANKHMKRFSALLIIREMLTKNTMRYHLALVRMVINKKSTDNECWRGCGEKETLLHCWWEIQMIQSLWRTAWRVL